MEALIEKLIADFHERPLPEVRERSIKLPAIEGKIDTVIGMRRVGKTYLLYQTMHHHLKNGITKNRLLYINFDDERLMPFQVEHLQLIPQIYYQLYPLHKVEKCFFFFDEIQNIIGWEKFIRRLLDTENLQITVTGSSAKLLSKEIATSLRGRAITTEVFPYSYKETLPQNFKTHGIQGAHHRALLNNHLRNYIHRGGFPEIQVIPAEFHVRVLQEYVDIVILRDIIERHRITNHQALRAMTRHLLNASATAFSVNKFYKDLKSQGINCTKDSLYQFLDHLHDAYLVFPISIYNRSLRIQRTNPRKVYVIDTGLINAFLHQKDADRGHLLENFIFLELRRANLILHYYKTQTGKEVDFLAIEPKGQKHLIQVTLDINESKTREREISALQEAMQEVHLKLGIIITLNHRQTISLPSGKIEIIPAWQYVLQIS